jgi:arabinogalactan oligomer/maltooligosaccharide transport system substrate-binding protein
MSTNHVHRLVTAAILCALLASSLLVRPGAAQVEPAAITGTVTLWYAYGSGSGEESALQQVVAAAETANPGLDIVTQHHDFPNIYEDYETAVGAGGGPDMYIAPNDRLGIQARAGLILNIDSYVIGKLGNVSQSGKLGMKWAGHYYGVPESAKAVALYYNKSMVAAPPTTTAALLSLLQGGDTLSGPANPYHFYGLFRAFGGTLIDSSGFCIADQGGFAPAMQYLLQLQAAGADLTDYGTAESLFLNGTAGMFLNGPWALAGYEDALGSNLGVAVLPAGPAGLARPMDGIDGFYVNPNSSQPATAVDVALYMTNRASSQIWTDTGGHVPIRSDVTSSNANINTFATASAQAEPRSQRPQLDNYWGPFQTMVDDVLAGNTTPTAGVREACLQMNELNGFTVSRRSVSGANQDGWVLESTETSGLGGSLNATLTTFRVGDDASDRQFRGFLSFDTSALPDNAVITKVTLKIKGAGIVATNPFNTHGPLLVDVRKGIFGTNVALQLSDFQAAASLSSAGPIPNTPVNGWYTRNWTSGGVLTKINPAGKTQFRLRFAADDNDDGGADYIKFYSGNVATPGNRPLLIITYHLP